MTGALHLVGENTPASGSGLGDGAREAELRSDAINAVGGVEVLDDDHLETGGAALAGGDDGPCEEELPDLEDLLESLVRISDKTRLCDLP